MYLQLPQSKGAKAVDIAEEFCCPSLNVFKSLKVLISQLAKKTTTIYAHSNRDCLAPSIIINEISPFGLT